MNKILTLILFASFFAAAQSNENYIRSTTYKSPYHGVITMNPVSFGTSSVFLCAGGGSAGGASGSANFSNNQLNISLSGSWASTCFLKQGTITALPANTPLPDRYLGPITQNGSIETGYHAKIKNQNLVFYSPVFITGTSTTLEVPYTSNISLNTSIGQIFACNGANSGGSTATLSITSSTVKLTLVGTWSGSCNISLGNIYTINHSTNIANLELGNIKDYEGNETIYNAKIENNVLKFYTNYTGSLIPPTSVNTSISYNFGTGEDIIEAISYFDGLGRKMQQINLKAGGQQQDIVKPFVYDAMGRPYRDYLPYADSNNSNNYRENNLLIQQLNSNYLEKFGPELSAELPNPYSEIFYEKSPLSKVIKQAFPGLPWKGSEADDNDHTIKTDYDVNTAQEVKQFRVSSQWNSTVGLFTTPLIDLGTYYDAGKLTKTIIKNENWISGKNNTTEEFKNDFGDVILKRSYNDNIEHNTYYIYNQYRHLCYVIPPKATEILTDIVPTEVPYTYTQLVPIQDFLYAANGGSLTVGGGGSMNIIIEDSTLKLKFSMGGLVPCYIDTSVSIPINLTPPLPDMTVGTLSTGFPRYTVYIENNHIKFFDNYPTASPFTAVNTTVSAALNPTQFSTMIIDTYVINQTVLDELCYQYKYDYRDRLAEKSIPGAGWEYIVYDRLDRPVMTQNQYNRDRVETSKFWIFTKYDIFDRPVYTGSHSVGPEIGRYDIQAKLDDPVQTPILNESRVTTSVIHGQGTTIGYSRNAYPILDIAIHTVNYYDNYNFDRAGLDVPNTAYADMASNTTGLLTGNKIRIEGITPGTWITTIPGYDAKGRSVYSQRHNQLLNTLTTSENLLDFTGNIVESKTVHKKNGKPDITMQDYYNYDHADRLLKHTQKINGRPEELIAYNKYDDLGQLEKKKVGGAASDTGLSFENVTTALQTIDYTYNIRGWLKSINNAYDTLTDDLFAFNINYSGISAFQSTPLYNGNISETIWKSKTDNKMRAYSYQYDALNRLVKAEYVWQHPLLNNPQQYENYSEGPITYDKNGNILSIQRFGLKGTNMIDKIDGLTYTYSPNSNRLLKVSDIAGPDGFTDSASTANDYTYDMMGAIKSDRNKGITTMFYNSMHMVRQINFGGTARSVNYVYDHNDVKLRKIVADNGTTTITEYDNGFVYQDGLLIYIPHPEGYIGVEPPISNGQTTSYANFDYVYQYRDHLGNIRLSYSDNSQIVGYMPFFTPQHGFTPRDGTIITHSTGQLNVSATGVYSGISKVILANATAGQKLRFEVSLSRGDTPNLRLLVAEVNAVTGITTYFSVPVTAATQYNFEYTVQANSSITLIFDKDETSNPTVATTFTVGLIKISNISYDILEENNYYPFGLTHKGYNNVYNPGWSGLALKLKYNGKELQDELNLNWYDYGARNYEASIGRWMSVDPLAETSRRWSPYTYCYNNPTVFVDPDGMQADWFENEITGEVYYNSEMRAGDEGTGAMKGEGWKHMGANGMFGKSDMAVLNENKSLIEGGGPNISPVYEQQVPYEKKLVGVTYEANFKGNNATKFMDKQGYEFRDKTSYSNIRTFFPVNQITPAGGSIFVKNEWGVEVVTAQNYVKKGMEQSSSIKLFESTDKISGYSSIFKTNYHYSEPSLVKSAINFLFGVIDAKNGDYSQENSSVDKVYGWRGISDKSLLKYKNK